MFLYIAGAVMLQCTIVSAAAAQLEQHQSLSVGMAVYLALFSLFIVDYLYHEHVHLYTYDLFAERVGFKLTWGCLCFYPFFYSIGVWDLVASTASRNASTLHLYQAIDTVSNALAVAFFVLGWALSRGANMQKYYFKLDRSATFLGIAPVTADGSNGVLLCSGWWGLARHINYLGEMLMAGALALCGSSLLVCMPPMHLAAVILLSNEYLRVALLGDSMASGAVGCIRSTTCCCWFHARLRTRSCVNSSTALELGAATLAKYRTGSCHSCTEHHLE
jgi:hypothetical protein